MPELKPRAPREHEIQKSIIHALRARGHVVMATGTRARTAGRPFSPVTPGCPDLYVLPAGQQNGRWFGLEVKRPGSQATTRAKQLDHLLAGRTSLVKSVQDALALIDKEIST